MDKASHLPLEIIDTITSLLRGNTKALRACTLLSPRWTISARRHLFELTSFYLDDPDDPDASTADSAASRLGAFATFLDGAPYVCDFVRELHLLSLHPDESDKSVDNLEDEDAFQVNLSDLLPVLTKLSALRKLVLEYVLWSPLLFHVAPTPMQCPWIETLHVFELTSLTDDFAQLGAIFYHLPGLTDLVIGHGQLDTLEDLDAEAPEVIPFPQNMRLRALELKHTLVPCVLASLVHTDTVNSLRSLEIEANTLLWGDIDRMGTLIEAVGPRLRHLRLEVAYSAVQNSTWDQNFVRNTWRNLRLSACTALRTLHLETDYDMILGFVPYEISPWVPIQAMLDSLPTTTGSLQRLILTTPRKGFLSYPASTRGRVEPRWTELQNSVLAFPALKSVRFVIGNHNYEDEDVDDVTIRRVRRQMPTLEAKGLLKFNWD